MVIDTPAVFEGTFSINTAINIFDIVGVIRPRLILAFTTMPAMSGFSLHKKIRELDDKVTIWFLTAADEVYYEILKKRHHNIDDTCVIRKPVDNDSLLRRIKSIF